MTTEGDGGGGAVAGDATDAGKEGTPARGRPNPVRRLYDWVVSWSDRPSGPAALFGLAAAESVFFPVPPDVLLIPLCLGSPRKAFRLALLCTVGSVVGALGGYWVGSSLYEVAGRPILELYGYMSEYETVGQMYRDNLVLSLGAAGFTPIPYKVFTIAAGSFRVPVGAFVAVSAVSRAGRFFLVAGLLRVFGEPVRDFIDRWFNLLTVVLAALVVGGFLVVKWLL